MIVRRILSISSSRESLRFSSRSATTRHKKRPNDPPNAVNVKFAMPSTSAASFPEQNFDNFLLLDFEATCEDGAKIKPCQEIIEFPVIQLDGKTLEEVSRFHKYVRPTERPDLTTFCSQLTGIIQEMVENQPTLPEVLDDFDTWLRDRDIINSRFIFVTCGDWDLQLQLPAEAKHKNFGVPEYFSEWINVKKSFCSHRGYFAPGMKHLLKELQLSHAGRLHSGIDDVTNIAAITKALAKEGCVFEPNGGARRARNTDNMSSRFLFQLVSRNCSTDVRVRFAPSPTGQLHLGGLRTALYNYLFARSRNGKFILRVEDTDQSRLVPGSVEKINDILDHYHLNPDEGPKQGGSHGPYTQSERLPLYKEYSERLIEQGHAYRCFCTPERLELLRKEAARTNQVPKYDMRCRAINKEESLRRAQSKENFVVRFKIDTQEVNFQDHVFGSVSQTIDESDPILLKSDNFPTYHFANIVDDKLMSISHVIRGMEWLSSTGKHVLLYKAFGWKPPEFVHLSLLTRDGRRKLSKRDADAFVDYYHKEKGYLPLAVLNLLIRNGSGIQSFDPTRLYSLEEMVSSFDLSIIGKRNLQVDVNILENYGRLSFQKASIDELIPLISAQVKKDLPDCEDVCEDRVYLKKVIDFLREKEENFSSLSLITTPQFRFFFTRPQNSDEATGIAHEILSAIFELPPPWTLQNLRTIADRFDTNHKVIYKMLRISLSGHSTGPPVLELYDFFGRNECLKRIAMMISYLEKQ
ncbi:unnamed protein product, partial [Mesorhabditis belari]|uniref:Nondiscriminating glutamyl-tRNA synthetase EARS2, mitochondrial n=1 Tax=Mesorhabditis belari TaxID=2138241 RepID=A0AAF3ER49_9BILA